MDVRDAHTRELSHHEEPTSGAYRQGDRIWNTEPTETDPVGWVCVADGDFGDEDRPDPQFKAFGV